MLTRASREPFFLVTCEHGGNRVPARYRSYFEGREGELESHRGHDPGALSLARNMARALGAPLVASTTSRLVVELNRSLGHRQLFSEALLAAPRDVKEQILRRYYHPYREQVQALVEEAVGEGKRVVHVSSHSFTPVLGKEVRAADIGLLYDPRRPGEVALCDAWQEALEALAPQFKVRRNYPYEGKADGVCTGLRRLYPAEAYVGFELEVNQKHFFVRGASWKELRHAVIASLEALRRAASSGSEHPEEEKQHHGEHDRYEDRA